MNDAKPSHAPESIAEVAVFNALEKSLYYTIPPELSEKIRVGRRVLAPLGRRQAVGITLALHTPSIAIPEGVSLRPLAAALDDAPVMPPELVELCRWMANYYFHPPGEVIQAGLPAEIDAAPEAFARMTPAGREAAGETEPSELVATLLREDAVPLARLAAEGRTARTIQKELRALEEKGWIERFFKCEPSAAQPKTFKLVRLVGEPSPSAVQKSEKLRALLHALEEAGGAIPLRELRQSAAHSDYWVRKLEKEGTLRTEDVEEVRESQWGQSIPDASPLELTSDQMGAFEAVAPFLERPAFQPFLLHGVTGSGKTEVYLRIIEEALRRGRGALVLVPEIALSTQLEALFRQRFGARLAIWHSGLSQGTRYDQWRQTLSGAKSVVLGVRSSVFMPVVDLGIIIVDEEHDLSYKQEDRLRYHARDVALVRARMVGIPVVLGSATPSLQTLHHCRMGRYQLIEMPRRILDRPLPALQVVDMRRERGGARIISNQLRKDLTETFERREQSLLFLNRRGFASFFVCRDCGHVIQCPHCSVSLTHHQKDNCLRCHYCGHEAGIPEACPSCEKGGLVSVGFGTERIEEEIGKLLPEARIVRIDRDTASRPRSMAELLGAVREQRADVLIGTQMIAKGHDFPNVTLVGVVNADTALQISDFRAGETTVQLLMQVAGRAGRGEKPGRVVLQTYNPTHYTLRAVLATDYMGFCTEELASREELQYPPFTRMIKLLVTAARLEETIAAAHALAALSREEAGRMAKDNRHIGVLGPAPAPIQKLLNRFRWHVYIKAWTSADLQAFTEALLTRAKPLPEFRRAQIAVDRDPVSSF